ncbi:hypothetical protein [Shimazuella soli]|nr:hypothetical protein [Shimazuella soli]
MPQDSVDKLVELWEKGDAAAIKAAATGDRTELEEFSRRSGI